MKIWIIIVYHHVEHIWGRWANNKHLRFESKSFELHTEMYYLLFRLSCSRGDKKKGGDRKLKVGKNLATTTHSNRLIYLRNVNRIHVVGYKVVQASVEVERR